MSSPLLLVHAAGEKHIGGRPHDEDNVLVRPDLGLFAVADGAGGDSAGNIASSIALAVLARHYETTRADSTTAPEFDVLGVPSGARRLSQAVHRAHREVLEVARSAARYRGMGTTLTAAAFDPETCVVHVANVGDSPCYRMRNGTLELLSDAHTLARDVLEMHPELDDAEIAKLPRNVITRALGMGAELRVTIRSYDCAPQDRFVITSDGIVDVLSDEQIVDVLQTTRNATEHAKEILHRALAAPAIDNIAVVVVTVEANLGVSSVPKLHRTRPVPVRRRSTPSEIPEPEIVIVEQDRPPHDTWDAEIHVVPVDAEDVEEPIRDWMRRR